MDLDICEGSWAACTLAMHAGLRLLLSQHACPCLSRMTTSHAVRCMLGTALRIATWGSMVNLGLSMAGKTRGFWATKVVNASVRTSRKLLSSRFNLRETYDEFRHASREVRSLVCPVPICLLSRTQKELQHDAETLMTGVRDRPHRTWRLGMRRPRRRARSALLCWTSCPRGEPFVDLVCPPACPES